MHHPQGRRPTRRLQQGAVGVEFALVFALFIGVFYAAVSFSMAIFVQSALNHAAAEGIREAARVEPAGFTRTSDYVAVVKASARTRVINTLAGLPQKVIDKVSTPNGVSVTYEAATRTITLRVSYPGYAADPLVPGIGSLPFIGDVNLLPDNIMAQTAMRPN